MLNVVVCGTPGTGKSTLIGKVKSQLSRYGFKFLNLSDFAIKHGCTTGYDEEFGCVILDEDTLEEKLVPEMKTGRQRNVIECIHGDLVPSELVDLVFVCRADNTKIYDRLKERNYHELKISNNVDAEIFQTILDEVKENFAETPICELISNQPSDLERNAEILIAKIKSLINRPE